MAPAGPHRVAAQLPWLGLVALPVALGAPMDSCSTQNGCIKFDVSESCSGDPCKYRVCMWWDGSKPGCVKPASDSISHICYHPNGCTTQNLVPSNQQGAEVLQPVITVRPSSTKYCDYVLPGGVAAFLVKDGSQCSDSLANGQITSITGPYDSATCAPNPSGSYWCEGNSDSQACIWKITAPSATPPCTGVIPPTCTCPNGVVDSSNCPSTGGVLCWSCSACYHLENGACVPDTGHNSMACDPAAARANQLAAFRLRFGLWGSDLSAVSLPARTVFTAGIAVGIVGLMMGAAFVGFWRVQRSGSRRQAIAGTTDEADE